MSVITDLCIDTAKKVLEGKVPLDTADQVNLLSHKAVWDRVVDDREARRIGEEAASKKREEVNKRLHDIAENTKKK